MSKGKNRTLYDNFELDGKWFLPNLEDHKTIGKLTYSKGRTILETYGNPENTSDDIARDLSEAFTPPKNIPIILGILQNGINVTLVDCVLIQSNPSLSGYTSKTYRALSMFIGIHFETNNDIKFQYIHTEYSNLKTWYGISGISVTGMDLQNFRFQFEN